MMPVTATIEVPSESFVLGRALRAIGDHHAELTQFVPFDDRFVPFLWIEHGDSPEVTSTLREQPQVASVTKYDERAGRTLYELEWSGPLDGFLAILMEQNVLVTGASATREHWVFGLLASDHEDITAFQTSCREDNISITVRSVSKAGPSFPNPTGPTEKQRDILKLAYERGYFAIPRETTVTELAEELNVTPQAASKRLRRALANTVDDLFYDCDME